MDSGTYIYNICIRILRPLAWLGSHGLEPLEAIRIIWNPGNTILFFAACGTSAEHGGPPSTTQCLCAAPRRAKLSKVCCMDAAIPRNIGSFGPFVTLPEIIEVDGMAPWMQTDTNRWFLRP